MIGTPAYHYALNPCSRFHSKLKCTLNVDAVTCCQCKEKINGKEFNKLFVAVCNDSILSAKGSDIYLTTDILDPHIKKFISPKEANRFCKDNKFPISWCIEYKHIVKNGLKHYQAKTESFQQTY